MNFSLFHLSFLVNLPMHVVILLVDAATEGLLKVRWMYPFGVDPVWHGSHSELLFLNSLPYTMLVSPSALDGHQLIYQGVRAKAPSRTKGSRGTSLFDISFVFEKNSAISSQFCSPSQRQQFLRTKKSNRVLKFIWQLVPVACLRQGPLSKQMKVVKDHDDSKTIGWSISNILNKANPDNFAPKKRAESKCTKDTTNYLRRYNSLLVDGRLKGCVDLLESMF